MPPEPVRLRPVAAGDEPLLWRFLTYAARMPAAPDCVAEAQANPDLTPYVVGWGRPADLGWIAEQEGLALGACWIRLASNPPRGFGYATETEPELAIGVEPNRRGQGVGRRLIEATLDAARGRHPAVLLNVRADNPAVRLYRRCGFLETGALTNRVGTRSLVMRRALEPTRGD